MQSAGMAASFRVWLDAWQCAVCWLLLLFADLARSSRAQGSNTVQHRGAMSLLQQLCEAEFTVSFCAQWERGCLGLNTGASCNVFVLEAFAFAVD